MRYRLMPIAVAVAMLAAVAPASIAQAAVHTGTLSVSRTSSGDSAGATCATVYTGGTLVDSECNLDSNTVVFTLAPGTYNVSTDADDNYQDGRARGVVVTSSHTTSVDIDVQLWAELIFTVVDHAGTPVPFACAYARPNTVGGYSPWTRTVCGDDDGNVLLDKLPAGSYQVFVDPADGVHGAQWVGTAGGVGRQELAATYTLAAGATDFAPNVTVDAAGSIAGHITDKTTGLPVADAHVSVVPNMKGISGVYDGVAATSAGAFTLSGLGPYTWPLEIASDSHAWQWGSGNGSRFASSSVTVTAGHTTTANRPVQSGGSLTGTVLTSGGQPAVGAWVFVENASTSDDAAAWVQTDATGHFTVPHLFAQNIRAGVPLAFLPDLTWYSNKSTFDTATRVQITNGTTTSITIHLPAGTTAR